MAHGPLQQLSSSSRQQLNQLLRQGIPLREALAQVRPDRESPHLPEDTPDAQLDSPHADVRLFAVGLLLEESPPDTSMILLEALYREMDRPHHGDWEVRDALMKGLQQHRCSAAIPLLTEISTMTGLFGWGADLARETLALLRPAPRTPMADTPPVSDTQLSMF